jgi:hypothetical protein
VFEFQNDEKDSHSNRIELMRLHRNRLRAVSFI